MKRIEAWEGYVVPNNPIIKCSTQFGCDGYSTVFLYTKPTGKNVRRIRITIHEINERPTPKSRKDGER